MCSKCNSNCGCNSRSSGCGCSSCCGNARNNCCWPGLLNFYGLFCGGCGCNRCSCCGYWNRSNNCGCYDAYYAAQYALNSNGCSCCGGTSNNSSSGFGCNCCD